MTTCVKMNNIMYYTYIYFILILIRKIKCLGIYEFVYSKHIYMGNIYYNIKY